MTPRSDAPWWLALVAITGGLAWCVVRAWT